MIAQTRTPFAAGRQLIRQSRKPMKWQDIVSYAVLTLAAILVLLPLLWMFSTSLRPLADSYKLPPQWLPTAWRWQNYLAPFESNVPFELFFLNSLKISALTTLGQLITCSMAGYAFARLRFPGRNFLFLFLLASLMVPGQVTIIPIYLMMAELKLVNTHASLILPGLISVFGVFLMRQFFKQMPQELFDAARVDGAGHLRTFLQIALPLAGPGLATLGIITFNATWNGYFAALIFLTSWEQMTLPQGIALLTGYMNSGNPSVVMAAVGLAILPVLIVFLVAQRWIIEALTRSGLKG
ncbi:MAG: carbohydrate ABC transporter permease [Chloroflexi bacterium]|nr:carbohydrate ABC transporter permease [Chloroflexota bacterium]MCY4248280.1 carbohydrate ABC transporter permease [Chloroflexota bacterium]